MPPLPLPIRRALAWQAPEDWLSISAPSRIGVYVLLRLMRKTDRKRNERATATRMSIAKKGGGALCFRSTLFLSLSLVFNLLTSFPVLLSPPPPPHQKTKKTADDHLDRHAPPRSLQARRDGRGLPRKARGPARRAAAPFFFFVNFFFFSFFNASFAQAPPPALPDQNLGGTQAPPLRKRLLVAAFLPVLRIPGIARRRRLCGRPRRRGRRRARRAAFWPPLVAFRRARRRRQSGDGAGRRAGRRAVLPQPGRALLRLDRRADPGGGEGREGGRPGGVEQDAGVGTGEL